MEQAGKAVVAPSPKHRRRETASCECLRASSPGTGWKYLNKSLGSSSLPDYSNSPVSLNKLRCSVVLGSEVKSPSENRDHECPRRMEHCHPWDCQSLPGLRVLQQLPATPSMRVERSWVWSRCEEGRVCLCPQGAPPGGRDRKCVIATAL